MRKRSRHITIKNNTFEWRMLRFLEEVGEGVLNAWLPKGYAESSLWRALFGLDKKKSWRQEEREKLRALASATLSRLKAKGLVTAVGPRKSAKWVITSQGKKVWENMRVPALPPEDGKLRIFIFDIPETHKTDRNWIRTELVAAGFVMLHKSVWIGRRPLEERFFSDLSGRGLFEYVHLFEIKEEGTLRNLDWEQLV
ncbi:MAG: hypothetical protein ACK4NX_00495 [Candidatus Paceibacteria bacterium]